MLGTNPKASVVAQLGDAWMERRDIEFVKIIFCFWEKSSYKAFELFVITVV